MADPFGPKVPLSVLVRRKGPWSDRLDHVRLTPSVAETRSPFIPSVGDCLSAYEGLGADRRPVTVRVVERRWLFSAPPRSAVEGVGELATVQLVCEEVAGLFNAMQESE